MLQGTASEALLVTMLAAKNAALETLRENNSNVEDAVLLSKLVAYSSDQVQYMHDHCTVLLRIKVLR